MWDIKTDKEKHKQEKILYLRDMQDTQGNT